MLLSKDKICASFSLIWQVKKVTRQTGECLENLNPTPAFIVLNAFIVVTV
jgi:hypothetical protein